MAVDISFVNYFAPIFAFLLVLSVMFGFLVRTKILGENKLGLLFISMIIATIFVSFAGLTDYVLVITPWIAVLVISLFFVLMLLGFVGHIDPLKKGIGISVAVIAVLIFLISGFVVFSDVVSQYSPVSYNYVGNAFTDFLYSPRVAGAIALLVVAAFASWILMKASGKK